jgi:hypothetical protein
MDEEQILDAIKTSVSEYNRDWARRAGAVDEQKFCEHNGVITVEIARKLGISNSDTRKALEKLVASALVLKSSNNAGCYCRWWPVGHLRELQEDQ